MSAWKDIEPWVLPHLGAEDDVALWRVAVADIYRDAEYLCRHNPSRRVVVTRLGACSHWLRPHQTRWKADGGFAWPTGYLGRRHSRSGLPEHDWSVQLMWSPQDRRWVEDDHAEESRRELTFRVTLPTRTASHPQAAAHTTWQPGPPPAPGDDVPVFYGFRKIEGEWTLRATSKHRHAQRIFEMVAEADAPDASD